MKTTLQLNPHGGDVLDLIAVLSFAERQKLKRKAAHFKRCCDSLKGKK